MRFVGAFLLISLIISSAKADVGWALISKPKIQIKVLVIDTGIAPHLKLNKYVVRDESKDYVDTHGHGTHVTGIVAYGTDLLDPLCDSVKIYSCKYYDPLGPHSENLRKSIDCVKRATAEHFEYLNYSGGGVDLSFTEFEAYRDFTKSGGIAVVASGNEGSDLTINHYYPASYIDNFKFTRRDEKTGEFKEIFVKGLKNLYVVENEDRNDKLYPSSNHHPLALRAVGVDVRSTLPNNTYGTLTGSSQASPEVLHLLLKQRCEEIKNSSQVMSN